MTSTGKVLAWGSNAQGQLGNGTTTDSHTPVPVSLPTGTKVKAISAGRAHSLALTSTGQVLAWGFNAVGQLGNGTTTDSDAPVPVSLPTGTTVAGIAAGDLHSLALTSTGQVLAWGFGLQGELGNGTTNSSDTPVMVMLSPGTTVRNLRRLRAQPGGDQHRPGAGLGGSTPMGELGNGSTRRQRRPGHGHAAAGHHRRRRSALAVITAWPSPAMGTCWPGGATTMENSATTAQPAATSRSR